MIIGFDLEIDASHQVVCAAAYHPRQVRLWYGGQGNGGGTIFPRMFSGEVDALIREITSLSLERRNKLVTFNGVSHDLRILHNNAGKNGRLDIKNKLVWHHYDLLYQIFCTKGFVVSLEALAQGLNFEGKIDYKGDTTGSLWGNHRYGTVFNRVIGDARLAYQIAEWADKFRYVQWVSQSGNTIVCDMPNGPETVLKSSKMPMPDISWMKEKSGINREDFTLWT